MPETGQNASKPGRFRSMSMAFERFTAVQLADLSYFPVENEAALLAAASAPSKLSDPKQKAAALVKASLAQLELESPQLEDALRDAKQALAAFRELGVAEGEATALRAVAAAALGQDAFGALQAANQALKSFKELGHVKGQAAAIHSIALAHMGKAGSRARIEETRSRIEIYIIVYAYS